MAYPIYGKMYFDTQKGVLLQSKGIIVKILRDYTPILTTFPQPVSLKFVQHC